MGASLDRRALLAGLTLAVTISPHLALAKPAVSAWRHMMISSGDNRPAIDLEADHLDEILAALHRRTPLAQMADHLRLTRTQLAGRIDCMTGEGIIRRDGHDFTPTVLVVDQSDAAIFRAESGIVAATAAAIAHALPGIHDRYAALPGFTRVGFRAASLFILSDCLLDNWQIDTVERDFLHKPRPRRQGGNYYYMIVEWPVGVALEPFGIYGNHSENVDHASIGLYGNQRYHGAPNLITLDATDRARLFGFGRSVPRRDALGVLADDLLRRARDPGAAIDISQARGLTALGLLKDDRVTIPIVSPADDHGLADIAAAFAPVLLGILTDHRPALVRQFNASPYVREGVAFEEFAIWWYHRFYTAVTDQLVREGIIIPPPGGVMTYIEAA